MSYFFHLHLSCHQYRYHWIVSNHISVFGDVVTSALHFRHVTLPSAPYDVPPQYLSIFPCMFHDYTAYVKHFCKIPSSTLKVCLSQLHPLHLTSYKTSSSTSCSQALLLHIWQHCVLFSTLCDRNFAAMLLTYIPDVNINSSRMQQSSVLLHFLYGAHIIELLQKPLPGTHSYRTLQSK